MSTVLWLRMAAVTTYLFAAGHALGALESWSPVGESPTLANMGTFSFDVMGRSRTYLDFYIGFGHYIGVLLVLQATLLWQLGAAAKRFDIRPLMTTMLIANVAGAVVISIYMFIIPIVMSWGMVICLATARLMAPSPLSGDSGPVNHSASRDQGGHIRSRSATGCGPSENGECAKPGPTTHWPIPFQGRAVDHLLAQSSGSQVFP